MKYFDPKESPFSINSNNSYSSTAEVKDLKENSIKMQKAES